ncbi:WecB/TagA/CpsF family glycosyltransferase [Pseudanabaenaceae cyanobacterium LEGE 13415]|nr:WecB/TagA/CpsF family glycosyltransferase [Pseudanabaenaceae cyanobacterium LEGE 13415]
MIPQPFKPTIARTLARSISPVSIFGIQIANISRLDAIDMMEELIQQSTPSQIFLPNAHTLNLAIADPKYHAILSRATYRFGDGAGIRIAARLRGVKMKANLVGTDLIPDFFHATANRGYRYFLLGADPETIKQAARYAKKQFPGWELAGYHHGYLNNPEIRKSAIDQIKAAQPHVLLVGMGNPIQETWIDRYQPEQVPLAIGVGGLFDHWGGNLKRAPRWVRYFGCEWLQLLLQQPKKWQRYLIGNFSFMLNAFLCWKLDRDLISKLNRRNPR